MTESETKHRMSAIQKSILLSLYLLSQRLNTPIAVSDLRRILNKERNERGEPELQTSNFSVSCKLLNQRGFLLKFRDKATLKVAYKLTDQGFIEGESQYAILLKSLEYDG